MSVLQREIKQTKPFGSLEEEAMLSLKRTATMIDHAFSELIKPYGLTQTLYNVLRIVRGAGKSGLCRYEVRDRLVAPEPDVTRLLDRLEKAGHVTRERDAANRRLVKAKITKQGLDLLSRLDPDVIDFHASHFGHLGEDRLKTMIDTLAAARARI